MVRLNMGSVGDDKVIGIQSRPHKVVTIGTGDDQIVFYRTELMDGDLKKVSKFHGLEVEKRLNLCKQLLTGLDTIHEKGYAHRDIKLGNCLYKTDTREIRKNL